MTTTNENELRAAGHRDPADGSPDAAELEREIDRLSLVQALHDVEVANGRVIDLTQRLVSASAELAELRRDYEELREQYERTQERKVVRLADRLYALARAWRS